ncbi:hypothetical protein EDC04DRAFT_2646427 [Pisolithus marmoratus]|nr:hypothetical protein EDC04DRAFT_2646427 [Pisolithus marmoratus]
MMNVVIAGESGIGKSSLINLIADQQLARTSSDSTVCTLEPESYNVRIDGHDFLLWDTPGFNEGLTDPPKTNYSAVLRSFLQRMSLEGKIDLLLYCMPASRAKNAMVNNYLAIHSVVPPATSYSGSQMEDWWANNKNDLESLGMNVAGHACVTALPDSGTRVLQSSIYKRVAESRKTLRNLIRRTCLPYCISPSVVAFPSSPLALYESTQTESEVNPTQDLVTYLRSINRMTGPILRIFEP